MDLGVSRKLTCDFLLVTIIVTLVVSATVFEILILKAGFSHPTLVWHTPRREPLRIWWWNLAPENWNRGATRRWRNHDASFLHFDTIPARDGQTDGQTDKLLSQKPALA